MDEVPNQAKQQVKQTHPFHIEEEAPEEQAASRVHN